jgi:hypothetical protein
MQAQTTEDCVDDQVRMNRLRNRLKLLEWMDLDGASGDCQVCNPIGINDCQVCNPIGNNNRSMVDDDTWQSKTLSHLLNYIQDTWL